MSFQTTINAIKKIVAYNIIIIFLALFIFVLMNTGFMTEAGYIYHYQDFVTGKIEVYSKPGIHFRTPFSYVMTRYKRFTTVVFGSTYAGYQIRRKPAITVRFADTYTAEIPATFRYQLPLNKDKITTIHEAFLSFDDLIDALLIKTSRDVVVNTATQYTGEEFFLGGFNQFKAGLEDQLRNGIYKTERKQVEIEQLGLAPVGLDQEESGQLRKTKTLIWKTVPVTGADGLVIRLQNPLQAYGIELTQVSLGSPIPERQLEQLLADKKRLVAARIKAVQEQETSKEQAKTAQLRIDIERTVAKQKALKRKELAIIAKQREVEEAQKQAEKEFIEYEKHKKIAQINKAKELAIAQAEREIQKAIQDKELIIAKAQEAIQEAKFKAAQFEAKATRERGVAEAEVLKAKYQARIPDIYLAEIQREIAAIIYPNLKDFKVTMPHNIINMGDKDNKLQTNLDVLSSFATLGVMEGLEKKALKEHGKNSDK